MEHFMVHIFQIILNTVFWSEWHPGHLFSAGVLNNLLAMPLLLAQQTILLLWNWVLDL